MRLNIALAAAATLLTGLFVSAADVTWESAAAELDCNPTVLRAIASVESRLQGFLPTSNAPTILFEGAIFYTLMTRAGQECDNPTVCHAEFNPLGYGAPGEHQYERLAEAMRLNASAAYMATAWGLFQLLGHRYRGAGFESVEDLVASMYVSEGRQIAAFVAFAKSRPLLAAAIRERDWPAIARLYNGPAWQAHRYDERLAAAFRDLGGNQVAAPAAAAQSAPAPEGADTAVPAVADDNKAVGEQPQADSEVYESEISAAEGSTADQPIAGATQPALPDADALLACLHGVQWPADPTAAFALLGAANPTCAQPPEALAAAAATSPRSLLFRPDVFSRLTGGAFDASHPHVSRVFPCEPLQGQSDSHAAGGIASRDGSSVTGGSGAKAAPDTAHLLAEARQLHEEAALAATEWGCYRVPGMWYRPAGHAAPIWLAQELAAGFPHDCRALLRIVAADGVKAAAMAAHDWQTAASLLWGEYATRCSEDDDVHVGMRAATAAERAQRLQAVYEHYVTPAP